MGENEELDLDTVEEFGIYDVNSLYVGTMAAWKKANFDYVKKVFADCDKWKKQQEERESTFRKKDISELRKSLHDLMRKTWPNPEDARQEYQGEWTINEQNS